MGRTPFLVCAFNRMQEIQSLIQRRKPHILAIGEANFCRHQNIKQVQLNGFTLLTTQMIDAQVRNCSRIGVYVRDEVKFKRLKQYEESDVSGIWLEVSLPYKKKIQLACVYRKPDHIKTNMDRGCHSGIDDQVDRWDRFVKKWEEAANTDKDTILVRDINIDLNDDNKKITLHQRLYNIYEERILTKGIVQIIKNNTRHQGNCKPLLINPIYTSNPENLVTTNMSWGKSDHNLIGLRRGNGAALVKPRTIEKRVFRNFTDKSYIGELKQVDWEEVTKATDLDEAAEIFHREMSKILDKLCPLQTIQVRTKYTPWLTQEIKDQEVKTNLAKSPALKNCTKDDIERAAEFKKILRSRYKTAEGE